MTMNPQSPEANAPCALVVEPTVALEVAAAETEPPVPAAELAVREQDRLLPIANVVRIMRRVVPPNAKISDDAKEVVQECVSEFISFVTGEANERCHGEHRKTVTAEDILWAMERLGFDNYVVPLRAYVQHMREVEGTVGRGSGRGDRDAQTTAPHAPAPAPQPVPMAGAAFVHGLHAQPAAFQSAIPAQGYGAAPLQAQAPIGAAQHFVAQRNMLGSHERSMAAYYGGAASVTGGNHGGGGCADEASSSNEEPPAAGNVPRPPYRN